MKKLVSCLLVVMMLLGVMSAFAEPAQEKNVLEKFLDETDLKTKDLALQYQSGDATSEFVLRQDGENIHIVSRANGIENSHIELTPIGIYGGNKDSAIMIRYTTIMKILQDIVKSVKEEKLPGKASLSEQDMEAVDALATAAVEQAQADGTVIGTAAVEFLSKFKPEYILDVKNEDGTVTVTIRSEALATATGEAVDGLMSNPALAEVVDRWAAMEGGKSFAERQKDWLLNREATLETIRTIVSQDTVSDDGHIVSHFEIGEKTENSKPLVCDLDAWIDAENNEAEVTYKMGYADEDSFLVYETTVNPDYYSEKLTSGEDVAEVEFNLTEGRITSGKLYVAEKGEEQINLDFSQTHMNLRGPKGGISTSVRETWTGKLRYEMYIETAEGKEGNLIIDFYEDDDALICDIRSSESEHTDTFRLVRVDKVEMDELTKSAKCVEITEDVINKVIDMVIKSVPTAAPETAK